MLKRNTSTFAFAVLRHQLLFRTCTTNANRPKVLVIAGATAIGKTKLSHALARQLNGEIISADSVKIHRFLAIGANQTFKRDVPVHLTNVLDPTRTFSAGNFYFAAHQITKDIISRGKLPIVSGGSTLYLNMYLNGATGALSPDEVTRKKIMQQVRENREECYNRIKEIDPEYAATFSPTNARRIERALEILELTGQPPSKHRERHVPPPDYDYRVIFLYTDRARLHDLTGRRCESMVLKGLLQEVGWLLQQRILEPGQGAALAVGYRQAVEVLLEAKRLQMASRELLDTFLDNFQAATRQVARKQLTWFRKEPQAYWLRVPTSVDEKGNAIADLLAVKRQIASLVAMDRREYDAVRNDYLPAPAVSGEEMQQAKQYTYKRVYYDREAMTPYVPLLATATAFLRGEPISPPEMVEGAVPDPSPITVAVMAALDAKTPPSAANSPAPAISPSLSSSSVPPTPSSPSPSVSTAPSSPAETLLSSSAMS